MGAKDTKENEYLSDNERFADLCNLALFNGEEVITAQDLTEKDSTEILSILGIDTHEIHYQQKWRDLLKGAIIKSTPQAVYVMIGVENQSDIHYAMPVKSMIYDALNYGSQVKEAAKRHKQDKDYTSHAEFLSGFSATDKLIPIIPITLYWGADKWDAPTSLSQMFEGFDERLQPYVPDYKIVLVSPQGLSSEQLNCLRTELKELLGAIKYSQDKTEFESFITNDPAFKSLNNETIEAINLFTGARIKMEEKGGATDVCKAIEDMKQEAALKNIRNLFENGCALEMVIASFQNVSEEDIRKIYAETKAPV